MVVSSDSFSFSGRLAISCNRTSDADKSTASSIQGPIYAIDSYSGKSGKSGRIHPVSPDGARTNNVGLTRGDGKKKNAGQFNLGANALRISGKAVF